MISTKLGAHVMQGQRNGYGEIAPLLRCVVAVDQGGAFDEVSAETTRIFRTVKFYKEAPHGMDSMTEERAIAVAVADALYPSLRAEWVKNSADYYTALNEPFNASEQNWRAYLAFEERVCQLASTDGFKICLLNFAGGSPGDIEFWKRDIAPYIIRMHAQYGAVYGRHAYGGDLVPLDGNTGRPFVEADYLRSIGANVPIFITELGFHGGFNYVGDDHFVSQCAKYDALMRADSLVSGGALWSLGDWEHHNPNWQTAIPKMIEYMRSVEALPPVEVEVDKDTIFDTLDYLRGDNKVRPMIYNWAADGVLREFPIQTQAVGDEFAMVRGNQVQMMYFDNGVIYLEFDGTQSNELFYVLQDLAARSGSAWMDRFQKVGHVTVRNPIVSHFYKADCRLQNGGWRVESRIQLVAHHAMLTLPNGVAVNDVLEFGWEGGERYWFAHGIGLSMWQSGNKLSYIKWINSDDASYLQRETIPCYRSFARYFRPKTAPPPAPIDPPAPEKQIYGLDVSHHQAPHMLNYDLLSQSGVEFVLIRGGYGTKRDSAAWLHYKTARDAGKLVGAWWFIDRRFDAFASGVEFGKFVNDHQWDSMCWFDAEDNNSSGYGLLTPTKQQVIDFARGYLSVASLAAGIYTNRNFWKVVMGGMNPADLGITDKLWLADWNGVDDDMPKYIPPPYQTVTISQELARGIGGVNLDWNAFFGSRTDFAALAKLENSTSAEPIKPPPPTFDEAAAWSQINETLADLQKQITALQEYRA